MVLSGLVQSLQRLFRNIREVTMVSCGTFRDQTALSTAGMDVSCSEDRAILASATAVVVDRAPERSMDRSFMGAARLQPLISRTPSSKRKLDELDLGSADSPALATSQVRPRREPREEPQDGSAAESSGRQGRTEAQALDGESRLREERGNEALDADALWEETPGWSGVPDGSPREKVREGDVCDRAGGGDGPSDCAFLECLEDPPSSGNEDEESDDTKGDDIETSSLCERDGEDRLCGSNGAASDRTENVAMDVDRGSSSSHLQFFVRTYIEGRTIVLHATASDTIETVHQQILARTGLPVLEQRLIFCGRQLQHDQTLEECHVTNDATLHLVARMRSTALPHSWQLINDLVATIRRMCGLSGDQVCRLGSKLMQCQDSVRNGVQEFLKMASKSVPVSEHMQVFQLSGATSALVMLLLSPVETNRLCAEDSINFFLSANDEYLPSHLHCHSAPVLQDFCKLLSKSAPEHSIYPSCRNALARLLDTIDAAHGNPCFNEAKAETIVSDFSPFVNELAESLSAHLQAYAVNQRPDFSSYIKEAKDFTAFVTHLCKAMAVCKVIDSASCEAGSAAESSSTDLGSPLDSLELTLSCGTFTAAESCNRGSVRTDESTQVGSHGWLDAIFHRLLDEVDKCLTGVLRAHEKSQEPGARTLLGLDDRPFARAPFLFVLKGLHAVARLCDRSMMKLLLVLQNQCSALNVLIRQSRWQDDDFWLLEHKSLLDFESKKRLVMAMLPEPQDDHDERQEIAVHRSQLLTESLEQLAYVEAEAIQGGLSVEFKSEEATGPGVLREWFFMVCKEIFNPQFALFLPCPNDRRRFCPNPASGVNPGHLTYFKLCGRVIALAMMHRVQIDVTFALLFFKQLAGIPISWEDAKDADPCLYASCKKILEMDAETVDSDALGLTFVTELELLGSQKTLELCPGGKDIAVNSTNRLHFVELLVQRRLVASVAEQVKSFSQGFSDLLVNTTVQQFLRPLELDDLDLMLCGKDREISLDDWKLHTEYHDYNSSDEHIHWFWQVIEGMTMEGRRKLLFFATSITHLPPEGFAGLSSKFHIHKAYTDLSWLPTAHTCFYQLILPPYPSFDIMHRSLYAITADHVAEGFGFA